MSWQDTPREQREQRWQGVSEERNGGIIALAVALMKSAGIGWGQALKQASEQMKQQGDRQ